MCTRRSGFTIIEMLFVVIIGAVVLGVGTRAYARAGGQRAVENARDAMILMASRARSEAVRTGSLVYLEVDPDVGLVEIVNADDSVLVTLDAADYGARIVGQETALCYTARGFALPSCGDLSDANRTIAFARGPDTARAVMMPLGQIRRSQ